MKYSPASGGGRVSVSAVLLLVAAAVTFMIPNIPSVSAAVPSGVVQFIALLLAVAGIFILVRFRFVTFTYVLDFRSDGADPDAERAYAGEADVSRIPRDMLDFTVFKTQGQRQPVAECILGIDELEAVKEFPGRRGIARELRREYGAVAYYDYTASPRPESVTVLVFSEPDKKAAIAVECDEKMRNALKDLISGGVS
ncbi:MAG: hypothetical protein IJK58_04460 [Clostridia bacterium]|nr:hypothetical protein [Clostridia bacterium]